MSKPTLFVALSSEFDKRFISEKLDKKFDIHYWPHTKYPAHEEVKANVKGVFGIIILPPTIIDSEIIDAAGENLRVVVTASVGFNHLDIQALKAKGIRIGYLGSLEAMTVTVAEHAIGLLLATTRLIVNDHRELKKDVNLWDKARCYYNHHQTVWNSVVGIIGCGSIGIAIIERLQAFRPKKFLYSSRKPKSEVDAVGGEWRSVDEVCKNSDFIIVTVALNKETHHLLDRNRLHSMKPNAIIINVARGGIIDEKALCEALRNKKIAGAGLDVYEEEPLQANNPILNLDNVVLTPHMAGTSAVVVREQLDRLVENILAAHENRKMPFELL